MYSTQSLGAQSVPSNSGRTHSSGNPSPAAGRASSSFSGRTHSSGNPSPAAGRASFSLARAQQSYGSEDIPEAHRHLNRRIAEYKRLEATALNEYAEKFTSLNQALQVDRQERIAMNNEFRKQFDLDQNSLTDYIDEHFSFPSSHGPYSRQAGGAGLDVIHPGMNAMAVNLEISDIDKAFTDAVRYLNAKKKQALACLGSSATVRSSQIARQQATEFFDSVKEARTKEIRRENERVCKEFAEKTLAFTLLQSTFEEEKAYYKTGRNTYTSPEMIIQFQMSESEKEGVLSRYPTISAKFSEIQDGVESYEKRHSLELTYKEYLEVKQNAFSKDIQLEKFSLTPDNVFLLNIKEGQYTLDPCLQRIINERPSKEGCITAYGIGSAATISLGICLMCTPGGQLAGGILLSTGMSTAGNLLEQGMSSSRRFDHGAASREAAIGAGTGAAGGLMGARVAKATNDSYLITKMVAQGGSAALVGGTSALLRDLSKHGISDDNWQRRCLLASCMGAGAGFAGGALGAVGGHVAAQMGPTNDIGYVMSSEHMQKSILIGGLFGGAGGGATSFGMTLMKNWMNDGALQESDFVKVFKDSLKIDDSEARRIVNHLKEKGFYKDGKVTNEIDNKGTVNLPQNRPHTLADEMGNQVPGADLNSQVDSILKGMRDIWKGVVQSAAQGALMGGVMGAITAAASVTADRTQISNQLASLSKTPLGTDAKEQALSNVLERRVVVLQEKEGSLSKVGDHNPQGGSNGEPLYFKYTPSSRPGEEGHYQPCDRYGNIPSGYRDTTGQDCLWHSAAKQTGFKSDYIMAAVHRGMTQDPANVMRGATRDMLFSPDRVGGSIPFDERGRALFGTGKESDDDRRRRMEKGSVPWEQEYLELGGRVDEMPQLENAPPLPNDLGQGLQVHYNEGVRNGNALQVDLSVERVSLDANHMTAHNANMRGYLTAVSRTLQGNFGLEALPQINELRAPHGGQFNENLRNALLDFQNFMTNFPAHGGNPPNQPIFQHNGINYQVQFRGVPPWHENPNWRNGEYELNGIWRL